MSKKIDFEKFDRMIAGQVGYGTLASPPYSTLDRLKTMLMALISDDIESRPDIGKDFKERVYKNRHDLITLTSLLSVYDLIHQDNLAKKFRSSLLDEFTDLELLSLTLDSKSSTLEYIKETIQHDILVNLLEGRMLFRDKLKPKDSLSYLGNMLKDLIGQKNIDYKKAA